MEQLEELQGRIQTALHRIYGSVAALEQKHANRPVPTLEELDTQKHAELLADLDDEKMANAQLEERLKLLHGRLEDMEKKVAAVDGAPICTVRRTLSSECTRCRSSPSQRFCAQSRKPRSIASAASSLKPWAKG